MFCKEYGTVRFGTVQYVEYVQFVKAYGIYQIYVTYCQIFADSAWNSYFCKKDVFLSADQFGLWATRCTDVFPNFYMYIYIYIYI